MRKITNDIVTAFLAGKSLRVDNSFTDGQTLNLHGNMIARKNGSMLEITHAGWPTKTTFARLNALPGVSINVRQRMVLLNGLPWDGDWIQV